MAITVKVSTQQLEAAAGKFDTVRGECIAKVREMMNIADNLKGSWKGEAANNFYNKLQQIAGDLNDMDRIINEHVLDLRAIEKVFETTENEVGVRNASLNADVLSY